MSAEFIKGMGKLRGGVETSEGWMADWLDGWMNDSRRLKNGQVHGWVGGYNPYNNGIDNSKFP
eukprot:scaffold538600_cov30-Prasinocladus_malaysianus.AAC.1